MAWFNLFGSSKTQPQQSAQLQEGLFSGGVGGLYDPDANLTPTHGRSLYYRRLTQTANRDLSPLLFDKAQQLAFWLYETTPMGKRIT